MNQRLIPSALLSIAALFAAVAHAEVPVKMSGSMLVSTSGMTLYTFDKDGAGKSACNGPCTGMWPPVMAAADAKPEGDMSIITRDDGSKQWAFKGKPVYLYKSDMKAGDAMGDNFKDVWHVAK